MQVRHVDPREANKHVHARMWRGWGARRMHARTRRGHTSQALSSASGESSKAPAEGSGEKVPTVRTCSGQSDGRHAQAVRGSGARRGSSHHPRTVAHRRRRCSLQRVGGRHHAPAGCGTKDGDHMALKGTFESTITALPMVLPKRMMGKASVSLRH